MGEAIPGIDYDDLHSVAKLSSEAHYKDVIKVRSGTRDAASHMHLATPLAQVILADFRGASTSLNWSKLRTRMLSRAYVCVQRVRDVLSGTTKEVEICADHLEDDPTYK
jgi:hypothetical protein